MPLEFTGPVFAQLSSCSLFGVDAFRVDVEVAFPGGLPRYQVVGLANTAVREGSVRIKSALQSIGRKLFQASDDFGQIRRWDGHQ